GSARRDRRLGRPDPARRRRSAVRKRGRCEAQAGRVGRAGRGGSHQIRPGIAFAGARGARGVRASPTVSPHSNRESALGGNALERDRNAPRQAFPARVLRNAPPAGTRSSTNAPLPTRDLPPFAAHLIAASSSAISKSLRSTAMAATNGVNDQVLRWQRELRGYRLPFPEARKPGAQRAREGARMRQCCSYVNRGSFLRVV